MNISQSVIRYIDVSKCSMVFIIQLEVFLLQLEIFLNFYISYGDIYILYSHCNIALAAKIEICNLFTVLQRHGAIIFVQNHFSSTNSNFLPIVTRTCDHHDCTNVIISYSNGNNLTNSLLIPWLSNALSRLLLLLLTRTVVPRDTTKKLHIRFFSRIEYLR